MHLRGLAGAVLFLLLLRAPRVHAGPTEDRAAADALFQEGRALVKQGKYAEACPKLAASHKLDPAAGTLLALGDCYDLAGQTASAWTTFNEAGAMARKAKDNLRADEANLRAGLLEPKLAKLAIDVAAENRFEGLEVRLNGKPLDVNAIAFGAVIPVDPGKHALDATAPGKQAWTMQVHIEAKPGRTTVRIPVLAEATAQASPVAPAPKPVQVPATSPAGASREHADRSTPAWSPQRTVGLVLGGVGVVGAVVGTVFGVQTITKIGEMQDLDEIPDAATVPYCIMKVSPPVCNQQGVNLLEEANAKANVANISLAVGSAALIAGAVVFATAPSGKPKKSGGPGINVRPAVGMGTAGLSVGGTW